MSGYDSPLFEYPDIPDSDKAKLETLVTGRFKMVSSGDSLTVSWDKTPGWSDDYVWIRVMDFNRQFDQAIGGEESEVFVLDNPGKIRFEPGDGSIRVVFVYSQNDEQRERAVSVPTRAVGEAAVGASEDLREELLRANQRLIVTTVIVFTGGCGTSSVR